MVRNGITGRNVENAGGGAKCDIEDGASYEIESNGAEEQILERMDRLVGGEQVEPIFEKRKVW